jgi:hypothetical protein
MNWDGHGGFQRARKSDSVLGRPRRRDGMARGYAKDLRERAVAMVEEGENGREIARMLKLAPPPGRYSLLFNHLLTKP